MSSTWILEILEIVMASLTNATITMCSGLIHFVTVVDGHLVYNYLFQNDFVVERWALSAISLRLNRDKWTVMTNL